MAYIYSDDDNEPMNDSAWDQIDQNGHNPTTYMSFAEMRAAQKGEEIPFDDPGHDNGCWNCRNYNGDFCTKLWNNMDECYKVTWRDEKKPDDSCEDWELEEDAVWEQFFEED